MLSAMNPGKAVSLVGLALIALGLALGMVSGPTDSAGLSAAGGWVMFLGLVVLVLGGAAWFFTALVSRGVRQGIESAHRK